ncbi:unnamed protein product [Lactuca saligna]|uniref:Uncharacterized protein n=1 Tax=Lactuca saligna TaxID=75948 RepID=A0AA35ZD43_LACSI|nr:unnamed protein product [Lactuca saligna]
MSLDHCPSTVEVENHQDDAAIALIATNDDEPPPLLISLYMTMSLLPFGGLSTPLMPCMKNHYSSRLGWLPLIMKLLQLTDVVAA